MEYYVQIPEYSYEDMKDVEITDLIGKTVIDLVWSENSLLLECLDKNLDRRVYYKFQHIQDCCESVWLDDIIGDLDDLIDKPILKAEEKTPSEDSDTGPKNLYDESHTWTFYTLATIKGYVDLRWYGTSNGYYSERVDIVRITPGGSN
jgi:hypothetical protein